MRLLRYFKQGLLKRRQVDGEYCYFITEKGELYEPRESLSSKVKKVFKLIRSDIKYLSLISDRSWVDTTLRALFVKYAKTLDNL